MSGKMKKGILKPLRYISQMFDGKEPEMQIGFPTDVKHVAHIGWDGPNVSNAPTWMKEYHSAPLDSASFSGDRGDSPATNPWASQEIVLQGGLGDSPLREDTTATRSERASVGITTLDSPTSTRARRSRRHVSSGSNVSAVDCTGNEPSEKPEKREKAKRGIRKNRKKDKEAGSNVSTDDLSGQEPPAVPKKSSRRKSKGSEGSSACPIGPSRLKDGSPAACDAVLGEAVLLPSMVEEKDGSGL